jgi:hypothetical protein
MENTDAGIEAESGNGQPRFAFQNCIEIIQNGVWRVNREAWGSG